jgi:hypothetical protein
MGRIFRVDLPAGLGYKGNPILEEEREHVFIR